MDEVVQHRFIRAAILVAIFMVVPGLLVGGTVANIYKWFLAGYLGQDSWLGFFNFINKVAICSGFQVCYMVASRVWLRLS